MDMVIELFINDRRSYQSTWWLFLRLGKKHQTMSDLRILQLVLWSLGMDPASIPFLQMET
jgi:hypothetical protein